MTQTIEPVEAVIISGPRKGEIIAVPKGEPVLTPDEESLLGAVITDAQHLAESVRAVAAEADLRELRQARGKYSNPKTLDTDGNALYNDR